MRIEIGADYTTSGVGTAYPFTFNAKVATAEDALFAGLPAFAVGAYNIGTISASLPQNIVYGLAARTFPVIGRISVGGYSMRWAKRKIAVCSHPGIAASRKFRTSSGWVWIT